MNADKPTILVPAEHGAPFEGGFYGGQIRIGDGIYAVVWAPKATGDIKGLWLPSYTQVPNTDSFYDSMANTMAMAAAGSPIAQQALAAEIAGHKDWCIPARDVLELAYRHLKPTGYENYAYEDGENTNSVPPGDAYTEELPTQTSVEAFRKGGAEAFEEAWYWSSTQASSYYAWDQSFSDGSQTTSRKKFEGRARLVRTVQLNA
jgi:hypothetical protein